MSRTRQRHKGEGSVHQRADGRWEARLELPPIQDEKHRQRRRISIYGQTRAEVLQELDRAKIEHAIGTRGAPSRRTVAQWLEAWLTNVVEPNKRPSTAATYRATVKTYLAPEPGHKRFPGVGLERLDRIEAANIQAFYTKLKRAGISDRTRVKIHVTLRGALEAAVRQGHIPKNPARFVEPPKYTAPEIQALNLEQIGTFLDACSGERLEALFVSAALTGMRFGELIGLRWPSLDLKDGWVTIRETLTEINGKWIRGEPKTSKSRRRIPLPARVVRALKEHRKRMDIEGRDVEEGLVFLGQTGEPVRRQNLIRRTLEPILERAELPPITFHALRHSYATAQGGLGTPVRVVSDALGHAKTSITMNTYSHAFESQLRDAADALDAALPRRKSRKARATGAGRTRKAATR